MQHQYQTFRLGHSGKKKDNFPKAIEHLGIILLLKYALNPQYAKTENEYLVNDLSKISSCNVCCFHCSAHNTMWKIFWQNSFPQEMLILQSWNQLISNFWGNAGWRFASCQLSHVRNRSPKTGASWVPRFPATCFVAPRVSHHPPSRSCRSLLQSWPAQPQSSEVHHSAT